jgi:uncharacterized membrane protein
MAAPWEEDEGEERLLTIVRVVYVLYLVALVFGVTAVVGVVMAFLFRRGAPDWVAEHFRFQIRTFFMGFIFIALMLIPVGPLALLVMVAWMVWLLVRCIRGLQAAGRRQPPRDPDSWLLG